MEKKGNCSTHASSVVAITIFAVTSRPLADNNETVATFFTLMGQRNGEHFVAMRFSFEFEKARFDILSNARSK